MQPTSSAYPAALTFDPPERIANWRPLVRVQAYFLLLTDE